MIRSRRQNFASLPQALSSDSANTHWNLSATMLSCPWSIWDSFRGIQSHTHNWSFGWITIKIHNKIKYLKVPTYDEDLYCARGNCENDIKAVKNDLHSDRTSATMFLANATRLLLACAAYVLHHALRTHTLQHTALAQAQPSTIIFTLFKIATQVKQYKDRKIGR